MYREWQVPGMGVLWRVGREAGPGAKPTVIPADGSADLILRDDELIVAGPSTRALIGHGSANGDTIGIRFTPGTAGLALHTDPAAFRNQHILAADAVPAPVARDARALLREVRDLRTLDGAHPATLNSLPQFAGGIAATVDDAARIRWTLAVRHAASAGESARTIAHRLGYSERQLQRRMLDHFGYGYTALRRVLRAARGQHLLRSGLSPVTAANHAGYSDQAHLTREFRELVGTTPARFAAAQAPRGERGAGSGSAGSGGAGSGGAG